MLLPKFVKKSWGWEYWFSNVDEQHSEKDCHIVNYCGKLLYVEHDKWSSNFKFHYHKIKDETFMVLEGQLHIDYIVNENEHRTIYLNPLETFRVKPGMKHRFTSVTFTGCKFIEVSTFHSDEDSFRCQWDIETGEWVE